mgnify:CR=1 FL=1
MRNKRGLWISILKDEGFYNQLTECEGVKDVLALLSELIK